MPRSKTVVDPDRLDFFERDDARRDREDAERYDGNDADSDDAPPPQPDDERDVHGQ